MIEAVAFTVVAIALYFVSDLILDRIEITFGRRIEHRSVWFFVLLLTLAIASFWVIRAVLRTWSP